MQKKLRAFGWMLGLLLSLPQAQADTGSDLASIGQGTHLYLRCNATQWDVSDKTRLKPGASNFLREIVYEVKESWMLDSGDDCIITETPDLNAWGAWQKYYGSQLANLKAPESARLRLQENSNDNLNFKIRYPALGRYRFVLNTRDGYFSVRKEAPAQSGEISWTLPGNMITDSFGRFFLSNYYPQNSLSLVDSQSGLPRWTYNSSDYISFYSNCSSQDALFVILNGRVAALSVATGREIWSTDLNGALKDNYGYLSCFNNNQQLYLSYGSDHTTLVSLNKKDGKAQWSWAAPAYAGVLGTDDQRVLITSYQDSNTILRALQKKDGKEVWQASQASGYYSITEDGLLYLINGQTIGRVATDSGKTLWSYTGASGDYLWMSFEQNRLYLHEKTSISLVDKYNGKIQWSYDFSRYADQYPYAQILKVGVVLIRINDYTNNWSRQVALNSQTGREIWEREDQSLSGYLSEDKQGGVWDINGKTITAIDAWTGTSRWSFTLNSTNTWENIMSVIERSGNDLFVSYGFVGSKYPPMGVLKLDANSGQLKWQTWLESSVYLVGSDNGRLILNAGYYGSTKALQK